MLPQSRPPPGAKPAAPAPGSPRIPGKKHRFSGAGRTPFISGHSSRRRAPDFGTEHRLSGFCAFSPAAKKHVFFAIKTVIFRKPWYKRGISGGVGTISTAEFFGDLAPEILRRKRGCRGLTVFPIRGCIWREQCQGMWMRGAGVCEQGPDKKIMRTGPGKKYC